MRHSLSEVHQYRFHAGLSMAMGMYGERINFLETYCHSVRSIFGSSESSKSRAECYFNARYDGDHNKNFLLGKDSGEYSSSSRRKRKKKKGLPTEEE